MEISHVSKRNSGFNTEKFTAISVLCLVLLSASVVILTTNQNSPFHLTGNDSGNEACKTSDSRIAKGPDSRNRMFSPRMDQKSCLSRHEATQYRKPSPHKPSPYLISKLRKHESLQQLCGPLSEAYNRTITELKSGSTGSSGLCKYIVWIPANGLGNRMMSLASTFLYALLTNRVLLLDHRKDMEDLFCEPFPETTWLLPTSFPFRSHWKNRYSHSFDTLLKTNSSPSHLYLNLDHSSYLLDKKLFYCEKTESFLRNVTWLMMLSDQHFSPYFFMSQTYRKEVSKMFPEKDTVFHHLGFYIFNPTNQVWGLITRFYDAYLAKADRRIGLQVRVFNPEKTPFQTVLDQLLNCTITEKILPETGQQKPEISKSKTSKAVLIASLYSEFYSNLSNLYWMQPTATGEVLEFYQASHERFQQFGGGNMHNMKAWAEIYLLSLTDELITSAWSTFGYVAQALRGLRPLILFKTDDKHIPSPSCERDLSMEPCFHFPPTYDCNNGDAKVDAGALLPYLRHCVDLKWGVKLVPDD